MPQKLANEDVCLLPMGRKLCQQRRKGHYPRGVAWIVAALIVGLGILMTPIPWSYIGLVWAYCLIWAFIEDWAKLHVYHHLELGGRHHRSFLERVQQPLHAHAR